MSTWCIACFCTQSWNAGCRSICPMYNAEQALTCDLHRQTASFKTNEAIRLEVATHLPMACTSAAHRTDFLSHSLTQNPTDSMACRKCMLSNYRILLAAVQVEVIACSPNPFSLQGNPPADGQQETINICMISRRAALIQTLLPTACITAVLPAV